MGWLIILVMALLTFAALWPFIGKDKGAMQFLAAAILLGLAGYAWQGRPGLAGSPKTAPERLSQTDSDFAQLREEMLGRFDGAAAWLSMAESYQRRGDSQSGAEILQSAIRNNPDDADLWVGLGNALVVHGGGLMSPAAQLAFNRAQRIAPDHPGPRFFYGLALAQGGNFDEAERLWRQLLADAPEGAEYRAMVQERLDSLAQARLMGQIPGGPPQGAPAPQAAQPAPPAGQ